MSARNIKGFRWRDVDWSWPEFLTDGTLHRMAHALCESTGRTSCGEEWPHQVDRHGLRRVPILGEDAKQLSWGYAPTMDQREAITESVRALREDYLCPKCLRTMCPLAPTFSSAEAEPTPRVS